MICANAKVYTSAGGKCALNYRHWEDGSISVTLRIARNRQGTSVEEVTIWAEDPADLEPLFGYLPKQEN